MGFCFIQDTENICNVVFFFTSWKIQRRGGEARWIGKRKSETFLIPLQAYLQPPSHPAAPLAVLQLSVCNLFRPSVCVTSRHDTPVTIERLHFSQCHHVLAIPSSMLFSHTQRLTQRTDLIWAVKVCVETTSSTVLFMRADYCWDGKELKCCIRPGLLKGGASSTLLTWLNTSPLVCQQPLITPLDSSLWGEEGRGEGGREGEGKRARGRERIKPITKRKKGRAWWIIKSRNGREKSSPKTHSIFLTCLLRVCAMGNSGTLCVGVFMCIRTVWGVRVQAGRRLPVRTNWLLLRIHTLLVIRHVLRTHKHTHFSRQPLRCNWSSQSLRGYFMRMCVSVCVCTMKSKRRVVCVCLRVCHPQPILRLQLIEKADWKHTSVISRALSNESDLQPCSVFSGSSTLCRPRWVLHEPYQKAFRSCPVKICLCHGSRSKVHIWETIHEQRRMSEMKNNTNNKWENPN